MRSRTLQAIGTTRHSPAEGDSPRGRLQRLRRFAPVPVLVGLALGLGGCKFAWPTFGATHGADVQGQATMKLYSGMYMTGLVVVAIVWGLVFWCVIRYRRRKNDAAIPRQFQENIPLEITYTILPLLIVLIIFAFTVITENKVDAVNHPAAATVSVVGYEWGWSFHYQNTDVTLRTQGAVRSLPAAKGYAASVYPQMVVPVGRTTKIFLRSADVVHDWYVHAFAFDRFAQPGVLNEFEITPTQVGVYPGQCSEYCGLYHSEMLFSVRVVPYPQFESWLRHQERHANQIPKHYPLTTRP
ncbi:MAG: cytochrome c oxidase subunit II [Acidimicrobiales bacterium]